MKEVGENEDSNHYFGCILPVNLVTSTLFQSEMAAVLYGVWT
jgi:hypothetical protein